MEKNDNHSNPPIPGNQYYPSNDQTMTQPAAASMDAGEGDRKRPFQAMMMAAADGGDAADSNNDNNNNNSNNPFIRKAVGKDGEPLSEKKLRRLEKNRLSARECRRRKREATENMEREINLLEGENLRLRLQLQVRFRVCVSLLLGRERKDWLLSIKSTKIESKKCHLPYTVNVEFASIIFRSAMKHKRRC